MILKRIALIYFVIVALPNAAFAAETAAIPSAAESAPLIAAENETHKKINEKTVSQKEAANQFVNDTRLQREALRKKMSEALDEAEVVVASKPSIT